MSEASALLVDGEFAPPNTSGSVSFPSTSISSVKQLSTSPTLDNRTSFECIGLSGSVDGVGSVDLSLLASNLSSSSVPSTTLNSASVTSLQSSSNLLLSSNHAPPSVPQNPNATSSLSLTSNSSHDILLTSNSNHDLSSSNSSAALSAMTSGALAPSGIVHNATAHGIPPPHGFSLSSQHQGIKQEFADELTGISKTRTSAIAQWYMVIYNVYVYYMYITSIVSF